MVAGAGADLYDGLQCPNPVCQKHSIDKLFRQVWHYFDQIVIGDNLTHDIAHHWEPKSEAELRERLLTRIDVLLYLRLIGAEELVQFREKAIETSDWRRELRRKVCGYCKSESRRATLVSRTRVGRNYSLRRYGVGKDSGLRTLHGRE